MGNWLKSFVHNVIIHPLMQFLPRNLGTKLHDKNANWAFGLKLEDNDRLHLTKKLSRKYPRGKLNT